MKGMNEDSSDNETIGESISRTSSLEDNIHYYNANVTIFVGHDSDITPLAPTFGIRWKLDEPFHQYQPSSSTTTTTNDTMLLKYELLPTPPGNGMHFMYDLDNGDVEMSYLYPIFLTTDTSSKTTAEAEAKASTSRDQADDDDGDDQQLHTTDMMVIPDNILVNTSGILEETPLIVFPQPGQEDSEGSSSINQVSKDGKRTVLSTLSTPTT